MRATSFPTRPICAFLAVMSMLAAGAIPVRAQRQERIVVRNSDYATRVESHDGVRVFVIDGLLPSDGDPVRIPRRVLEFPVTAGVVPRYALANVRYAAPLTATPFYRAAFTLTADSALLTTVHPAAAPDPAQGDVSTARILAQRVERRGRGLVVRVEVPLLVYDRGTNSVRWIEQYELVRSDAPPSAEPPAGPSADAIPPYASMPFITQSDDADTSGTWIDHADRSVRFFVQRDSVYRITKAWLEAAGISTGSIDPRGIRMYRKGKEVPLYAVGLDDGSFDEGDALIFTGERNYNERGYRRALGIRQIDDPYPEYINRYGDSTAYWIVFDRPGGMRIADAAPITAPVADTLDWAYATVHSERDAMLFCLSSSSVRQNLALWTSEDTWMDDWIYTGGQFTRTLTADHIKPGINPRIYAKLLTWAASSTATPQYRPSLSFNGGPAVDSAMFNVNTQVLLRGEAPAASLVDGANTLTITNPATDQQQGRTNELSFDWFDLEYPRLLSARSDVLRFAIDSAQGAGARVLRVTGLTQPAVVLLKRTATGTTRLQPVRTSPAAPYTVEFTDTVVPGASYALAAISAIADAPAGASVLVPDLRSTASQAQYILITAREFLSVAQEYAAFIGTAYGLSTRVVAVEDIYDNYSYGMFDPEALKVFLFDAAMRWTQTPPRYVLLAGDANYNYKLASTSSYGRNYVPSYGVPVSDTWFVAFDSLCIEPTMNVGRLPVSSSDAFRRYLEKHRSYVAMPYDIWNKTTMHFSGGDATLGEAKILQIRNVNLAIIDTVVSVAPFCGKPVHFYKTVSPLTDFGPVSYGDVQSAVDEGAVLISYLGHSGTTTWDNSIRSVDQLKNAAGRSPLITDYGCSTAKFAEPDIVSFSEKFVLDPDGQAIAYIGNSSLGFESTSFTVPQMFYSRLIRGGTVTMSEAHRLSKEQLLDLYGQDAVSRIMMLSNSFIGDPAVRLPLPPKPNLVMKSAWIAPRFDVLSDASDSARFRISIWNYGMAAADSVMMRIEDVKDGTVLTTLQYRIAVPCLRDSLDAAVPIRAIAGTRTLRVTLDSDGSLDELSKSDNAASVDYYVFTTYARAVDAVPRITSGMLHGVRMLNPLLDPGPVQDVRFEFDRQVGFPAPSLASATYGKTVTDLAALPALQQPAKYWWRASLDRAPNNPVGPYAFWTGVSSAAAVCRDSADFFRGRAERMRYDDASGLTLESGQKRLGVASASGTDGTTGIISVDGVNVLPTTFFRSYAVVVFDSLSLAVKRQRFFDLWGSDTEPDSLNVFLSAVQHGEIIAIATCDEPARRSERIRASVKAFGSRYIDSLFGRAYCQWSLIGWRGAATGTVPESFKPSKQGFAIVDTALTVVPDTGRFQSAPFGPAAAWRSIRLERTRRDSTTIQLTVIGIDTSGREAVLLTATNPDTLDVSSVDASRYPMLEVGAQFIPGNGGSQPAVRSMAVDYRHPAELAVNYQSITPVKDTVEQGAPLQMNVGVVNAGDADAGPFAVHIDAIDRNNVRTAVTTYTVPGLKSGAWDERVVPVPTSAMQGPQQIVVLVDPENAVREQYEDNNVYNLACMVLRDTTRPALEVLFDGVPPLDGDYIRSTPEVSVGLRDLSPLRVQECRGHFSVSINDNPVECDSSIVTFVPGTPAQDARLIVRPTLPPGDHLFAFNAVDASGNKALDKDMQVLVRVTSANDVKDVYTFPNPFKDRTSFSFVLTGSQVPERVDIKLYTVAGRLIRTLTYAPDMLRIGFNALPWDGRDEDGDPLANGVYFYKVISRAGDGLREVIGRLAVLR